MTFNLAVFGPGDAFIKHLNPAIQELGDEVNLTTLIGRKSRAEKINKLLQRLVHGEDEEKTRKFLLTLAGNNIEYRTTKDQKIDRETLGLLKQSADAVYLATPNNLRIPFVNQLAKISMPLIIEKPLAHTLKALEQLVKIINHHGVPAICAEHYSYKTPAQELFASFHRETKQWGNITRINGFLEENDYLDKERNFWLFDPEVSGGGIFLDTGIHLMHLLHFTGAKLTEPIEVLPEKHRFDGKKKHLNDLIKSETSTKVKCKLYGENIDPEAYAYISVGKCKPEQRKSFHVKFKGGDVDLNFLDETLTYTPLQGFVKRTYTQGTKPYANMLTSFAEYLDKGITPPTDIHRIAESTRDTFRVVQELQPFYQEIKNRSPTL